VKVKKDHYQDFEKLKSGQVNQTYNGKGHAVKSHDNRYKDDDIETTQNYDKIWDINPSFKDMKVPLSIARILFLITLISFILGCTQIITDNFYTATFLGGSILIFFVLVFQDSFFGLKRFFSCAFRKFTSFNPFGNLDFFFLKGDKYTIHVSSKTDAKTVGIRIFKVETIPDNVSENINQFLKALSGSTVRIPFSYQVVQSPLTVSSEFSPSINNSSLIRGQSINSEKSFKIDLYFCVHFDVLGILTKFKTLTLKRKLEEYSDTFKSFLVSNFHHFKIVLLTGTELINALRTFFVGQDAALIRDIDASEDARDDLSTEKDYYYLIKLLYSGFLLTFCFVMLLQLKAPIFVAIIFDLILLGFIVFLYWRGVLYQITKKLLKKEKITRVYPFKNVSFYSFKRIPDAIFLRTNDLLIETKIFNLIQASPVDSKYYFPEKFFEAMIYHETPLTYTLVNSSITFDKFYKQGYEYLNENARAWVLKKSTGREGEEWLQLRSGIWRTILTLSISCFKQINSVKMKHVLSMDEELSKKLKVVKNSFETSFRNFYLELLEKGRLNSGFTTISLKSKLFKLGGTHLNYLLFQGKELVNPLTIVDEFKKGMESRIGAEFNTPLYLKNFISFGKTINTEFLEEEIPAGFTLDQIKNLLVVNGTQKSREDFKMKLVAELVKARVPSVVFDFDGKWSRLMNYFKDSKYEDDFLHFTLGSSFNINLIHSGLSFDQNNFDYLNLVFDAFAIAMKEDKRTVNVFKNMILDNKELDLSTITLNIQNQQRWEKDPRTESLVHLVRHLPKDTLIVSGKLEDQESDFNAEEVLNNDKTVIIDLSIQNDVQTRIFFAFVILSKIIHYINNKNSNDFKKKIILIPNVDLFFEANFIDNCLKDYGKIDKFLEPLVNEGFGLIFSANQVRYLHTNLYNYFGNIVTFRAFDKRDMGALISLLNLRTDKSGIYSSKRKDTYQQHYLSTMSPNEIIFKRSDIYQPFPCSINLDEFSEYRPLTHVQIIKYMKKQGYDLKLTERKLLQKIKKTLFQKDLGKYEEFTEEVISFLEALSNLHDVGNLYKSKIKEQLKKFINEKASRITQNKRDILKFRNDLLDILIAHGYLVENHPKTAGGSESMMVSYRVGHQFKKALDDLYETKKNAEMDVEIETIENISGKEYEIETVFGGDEVQEVQEDNHFKKKIEFEVGTMAYDVSEMRELVNAGNFDKSLDIGKKALKTFLNNLHTEYRKEHQVKDFNGDGLSSFFNYLSTIKSFPLDKRELFNFVERQRSIEVKETNPKSKAIKIQELLERFIKKFTAQVNLN